MPTKLKTIQELNSQKPTSSVLTAIEYVEKYISSTGITRSRIRCVCKCGNEKIAIVGDFLRGNPISCGCEPYKTKHSIKEKGLYKRWYDMIKRCKDITNKYYGQKGCKVCDEWSDYNNFSEWSMSNGYSIDKQLDKDIKGNGLLYSPETCCWITALDNVSNRSTSKKYQYKDELLTLSQICRNERLVYTRMKTRIYGLGKTLQQAIAMG